MSSKSNSYRDLDVWKKAIILTKNIYEITDQFPARENFGLSNQLRRCAVSIASNIAEGQARNSNKEFRYFLNISLGSLAELETQLIISHEINYISKEKLSGFLDQSDEVIRMIKGLINYLKSV